MDRELTFAEVVALEERYPGDMLHGFYDALDNLPWPHQPSPAYQYGRLGVVISDEREAA